MKALSIRQPWAWYILNAGKDIENRCWRTKFRGRVLIHAAKGLTRYEYEQALCIAWDVPAIETIERGGFVGSVEIVDCVDRSDSPWFDGHQYGFVLRDPKPYPFIACRGALGFFDVPADVAAQVEAAMQAQRA